MRDWRTYVREHLPSLPPGGPVEEEVVAELAEHLDEAYVELLASGFSQAEAVRRAKRQVGSWSELCRGIHAARQEGEMQERVKQFWLPSLVTLLLGWGIEAILTLAGVQPFMTHPGEPGGLIICVPWLVALPFVGALGAYMARRAQAAGWRVYLAGAFPAVATGLVFLLILSWAFLTDTQVAPFLKLIGFAAGLVSWVLMPGVALCLGVAVQRTVLMRQAGH